VPDVSEESKKKRQKSGQKGRQEEKISSDSQASLNPPKEIRGVFFSMRLSRAKQGAGKAVVELIPDELFKLS